jgi:DNA-binding GntR family transcriptional regulator
MAQGMELRLDREPVFSKSLTASVYSALRADILACRLHPGCRLKTSDLCLRLGAGLSAVREALSKLSAEGLVVSEPQRGFKVAPVSLADLVDLTNTRIEIETLCLKRAMQAGGVEWEASLISALHRMSRTPEWDAVDDTQLNDSWIDAHTEFHHALSSACDSAWLLRIRKALFAQAERYHRLSASVARRDRDVRGEHKSLVDAVLARDFDAAAHLLRAHLSLTQDLAATFAEPSLAA